MRPVYLLTLLASVTSVGCTATTSSQNIRTAGLVTKIDITSETEGQSRVEVDVVIGGANSNTYVVLEGGDGLEVTAGGSTKPMQATSDGEYEAKFPVSEGEFVVALMRGQDDAAPGSKGTLPPPFEITTEYGATPISRTKPIVVTWSPSGTQGDVEIVLSGECLIRERFDVGGDPGTFTIQPDQYKAWKSKQAETCDATLTITRTTKGSTDPALDSDSFLLLHQVRSATLVSAP